MVSDEMDQELEPLDVYDSTEEMDPLEPMYEMTAYNEDGVR